MHAMFPRRTFRVCLALLALCVGWGVDDDGRVAAQAQPPAATPEETFFSAFKWRSIGPDRGGRSIAVSGVKGRPKEAYFGAVGGGLWKTADGGMKWAPVTDGQINSSSVGAVAVADSRPDGLDEPLDHGSLNPGPVSHLVHDRLPVLVDQVRGRPNPFFLSW